MKVLAIIPARAGSKGIPKKNLKVFDGLALIEYSIIAAQKAKKITRLCVSSDSEEIIDIASKYENVYLHKRSPMIAIDTSPIIETILAVIDDFKEEFDCIMLLQPTSPIRMPQQIDDAITCFEKSKLNGLISVTEMDDTHPARMYWKNEDNFLSSIMPEFETARRQEIPKAYYRNGSIYISKVDTILRTGELINQPSVGFIMPKNQLLNIDDERDMLIAEALIKEWKKNLKVKLF
jgi:CMP-N,N'-diacetyllegionaminic acid synthase